MHQSQTSLAKGGVLKCGFARFTVVSTAACTEYCVSKQSSGTAHYLHMHTLTDDRLTKYMPSCTALVTVLGTLFSTVLSAVLLQDRFAPLMRYELFPSAWREVLAELSQHNMQGHGKTTYSHVPAGQDPACLMSAPAICEHAEALIKLETTAKLRDTQLLAEVQHVRAKTESLLAQSTVTIREQDEALQHIKTRFLQTSSSDQFQVCPVMTAATLVDTGHCITILHNQIA